MRQSREHFLNAMRSDIFNCQNEFIRKDGDPLSKLTRKRRSNQSNVKQLSYSPLRRFYQFKQDDEPKSSFYLCTEQHSIQQTQPIKQVQQSINSYNGKDDEKIIFAKARDKKILDSLSDIFYEPLYQCATERSNKIFHQTSWNDPFINNIKTRVNEDVSFDHTYARKRLIDEQISEVLPSNGYQPIEQFKTLNQLNQPNQRIKRENQNFSDLFNQELGYKEGKKGEKMRPISPSTKWTDFDSIRNGNDAKDICQVGNIEILQQRQSPRNWAEGQSSILDQNSRELKQNYQKKREIFAAPINSVIPTKSPNKSPIVRKKIEYEGIYKWKNNYRHK